VWHGSRRGGDRGRGRDGGEVMAEYGRGGDRVEVRAERGEVVGEMESMCAIVL
jgi:hypothetical protein